MDNNQLTKYLIKFNEILQLIYWYNFMRRSIKAKWNVVNQQLSFLFSQTIMMTDRRKMIVTNVTMTLNIQPNVIQSLMPGQITEAKFYWRINTFVQILFKKIRKEIYKKNYFLVLALTSSSDARLRQKVVWSIFGWLSLSFKVEPC